MFIGNAEVRSILKKRMINTYTFNELSNLVTESLLKTVNFRSWVGCARVSGMESIVLFSLEIVDKSDSCDF